MVVDNLKFKINNQKGAAAVEFAIVLPLLLIFIFGIIEFSLLLYNQQVITNAVREGARRGVIMRKSPRDVPAENNEIVLRIHEFADSHLVTFGSGSLTPYPLSDTRDTSFGKDLVVGASFNYHFLFLFDLKIGSININMGTKALSSVATMKME